MSACSSGRVRRPPSRFLSISSAIAMIAAMADALPARVIWKCRSPAAPRYWLDLRPRRRGLAPIVGCPPATPSPVVSSGDAWSDAAERFVDNRARPGRELVQADAPAIIGAEERDDIARTGIGNVRNVDDALVHRDSADQRRSPTSDEGFGAIRVGPRDPIGVAERNESHP